MNPASNPLPKGKVPLLKFLEFESQREGFELRDKLFNSLVYKAESDYIFIPAVFISNSDGTVSRELFGMSMLVWLSDLV